MRFSILALLFVACPAAAQDHPALDHPDLSGFWSPDFGPVERPQDLMDALPDDAGMVEDTGIAEYPRGEFGELVLTPQARERAAGWNAEDDMTIARVCLPPSIVYALQGPFSFEIHQMNDVLIIRNEYFDQTRLVWMDGRDGPDDDYPHSKMGHSTGYWDGDDLVIDTTHISASTITNNGLDHTDQIVMQERYRLSEDGQRLMATQWFSDSAAIENDGARFISWSRRDGEHIYPYECDPSFALEYQQRGGE